MPPPSPIDARFLARIDAAFTRIASEGTRIDAARLQAALGLRSEYLAKRVLSVFDGDGDGSVDRDEFLAAVRDLLTGSDREKLRFAFRVHDHDGDGFVSREELVRMISISLAENQVLERPTQPAEYLAGALLALGDRDRDGRLSFDELEAVVRRRPELLRQMTRTEAMWIAPNEDLLSLLGDDAPTTSRLGRDVRPAIAIATWALLNVAVFAGYWVAHAGDAAMTIGRASARCLALDGALVFVPMMRRALTRVRASALGRILPVDHAVDFHKLLGHTLFGLSLAHAAAFAVAYARGHAHTPLVHLASTWSGATGSALLLVFGVMWVMSLPFVRRSARFELFYFTHLLYVAWVGLALAHAPSFALWAGVPLVAFAVEQALRLVRRAPQTAIRTAEPLRSGVTRLELERPLGFTFRPGDYAFLCVDAIARHEWHPFTISSSPERSNLVFHVRSLGNWSSALRRLAAEGSGAGLTAHVDGPYGSPSGEIFRAGHVVLVGAGIGVTPFASVLETLVLRANAGGESPPDRKVHFVWVNRDQYSFEWFSDLLTELERLDHRQLLDVQLFMTGARAGATALGLEVAREVVHAAGRSDLITGLRTHTHAGAPDWDSLLGRIAEQHGARRVDVFFCGPPGLGAKVRSACARLGLRFHEERF